MDFMLRGDRFFDEDFPLFLNRETEAFHLKYHSHDFIEICLVEQGGGFHYIEDELLEVRQGDLFLLPTGTKHVFRPTSPEAARPLVILNCIFRPEALQGMQPLSLSDPGLSALLAGGGHDAGWRRYRDRSNRISSLMQSAHAEYIGRRPHYRSMVQSILLQLLILLDREHTAGDEARISLSPDRDRRVEEAIAAVQHSLQQPPTLQQAAGRAYMSIAGFRRLFRLATGLTYHNFVQRSRIRHACELLLTTKLDVQEIAAHVGYSDMKFFYKLFRSITGTSPRRYRFADRSEDT